jgi:hypothetical protein
LQKGDTVIHSVTVILAHLHPARDLVEAAQAAAADIVTKHRAAMTYAR